MTYTGQLLPNAAPQLRQLENIAITKFSVGSMDNNVYLLRCNNTGRQLLVDAADDAARIAQVIGDDGLETIITTHKHWDHIRATAEIAAQTHARSLAHVLDAADIPAVTRTVEDGDTVDCGDFSIEVIHLSGHTPGSIALLYRDPGAGAHLFTGDSLFPGGVGKTSSDADFESLINDVENKVFNRLTDDTWIYPGHGNDTTLGQERPQLAQWRQRRW